jgi:hypothetical protein
VEGAMSLRERLRTLSCGSSLNRRSGILSSTNARRLGFSVIECISLLGGSWQ